ncbi:FkbM family methyltransferase [Lachnospiraceae bacterium]|nr:FkbM family methyltransferase [Lachnospiraceae bacterium]
MSSGHLSACTGEVYSFEPDPSNYKRAVQNLSVYERIDLIPCGISSRKTELMFESSRETEGLGSHMMPNDISSYNSETLTIPATSLDQFFADKPKSLWPTIIKIDIEGGEKEALIGAQNIIKAQKPQLIVCAYHKPEDIYELPETILKIRDDYRLSLWQIGQSFWDLILYAI